MVHLHEDDDPQRPRSLHGARDVCVSENQNAKQLCPPDAKDQYIQVQGVRFCSGDESSRNRRVGESFVATARPKQDEQSPLEDPPCGACGAHGAHGGRCTHQPAARLLRIDLPAELLGLRRPSQGAGFVAFIGLGIQQPKDSKTQEPLPKMTQEPRKLASTSKPLP